MRFEHVATIRISVVNSKNYDRQNYWYLSDAISST